MKFGPIIKSIIVSVDAQNLHVSIFSSMLKAYFSFSAICLLLVNLLDVNYELEQEGFEPFLEGRLCIPCN